MTSPARTAALVALAALGAGCGSSDGAECDCLDPALTVNIPPALAPSVTSVQVSGTGCMGVTPTCSNQTAGCSQYSFEPSAVGTCHVEVDSAAGVFAADVTIVQTTGCCAGLAASPESAATIDVPTPDGG